MTGMHDNSRGVREQVLSFMKDRSRTGTTRRASSPGPGGRKPPQAFSDLPEYQQILAQASAGDQLAIANPFFRSHAGSAGATTMIGNRELVNFASYDYLGLNRHPSVRAAAADAIARYGISASASRLVAESARSTAPWNSGWPISTASTRRSCSSAAT